ncbi:MAG: hypothetical protein JSV72_19445 [Ralstonia sp.]|nr:MAG: hypothetical protein JSV72_19445 [Ralstonia sp.]
MSGKRMIGFVLMVVGFLAAAFVAVRQADSTGLEWNTIEWKWYLPAFVIGAAGVVVLRMTARGAETHAHKLDADMQTLATSLERLVAKLAEFVGRRESIDVYDVHKCIDAELVEDLGAFVDARESLIHRYGLQPYADLMSRFALAERNINRAWSASADGYVDEVWASMQRAKEEMAEAQALFQRYQQDV